MSVLNLSLYVYRSHVILAKPAKLLEWNLILLGTGTDPLEQTYNYGKELLRRMKTRDHDPNEGGSVISSELRESMKQAGIILPDIEWMLSNNKPNAYKPPVYRPADKPDFEYIKSEPVLQHQKVSAEGPTSSKVEPIIFNHGDHSHQIRLNGLLVQDVIGYEHDDSAVQSTPFSGTVGSSYHCWSVAFCIVHWLAVLNLARC